MRASGIASAVMKGAGLHASLLTVGTYDEPEVMPEDKEETDRAWKLG